MRKLKSIPSKNIPDEDIPLAPPSGEMIPDEDLPLSGPQTGDTAIWIPLVMLAVSAALAAGLGIMRFRKREEE